MTIFKCLTLLCATMTIATAAPAQESGSQKQRIAVLEISSEAELPERIRVGLNELAMAHIQSLGYAECIGPSDIKAMLGFEQQKQLIACEDDASCVAEIGGALGVKRLLVSSINPIGSQYLVSLKLFDIEHARAIARLAKQVPANEDKLLEVFPQLVLELFRQAQITANRPAADVVNGMSVLEVRSEPTMSEVILNGRPVGSTPVTVPNLAPGSYDLQITHRDYSTYIGTVTLVPGEKTIREIKLELDREMAVRNYKFALEHHRKQRFWETVWGLGHVGAGGLTTFVGTMVLLGSRQNGNAGLLAGGVLITAAGAGWLGWGIYKLATLPDPPKPIWEDEHNEQDKNATK